MSYRNIETPCFVCEVEDELGQSRGSMSHPINCGWGIRQKNDILESTLREVDDILREAIIALDNGRKVNGLEFARSGIAYALSTKLKGDVKNVKSDKHQK